MDAKVFLGSLHVFGKDDSVVEGGTGEMAKKGHGEMNEWKNYEFEDKFPRVTVIIPTYKRTVDFLSRAVKSVINQTYPNVEIIVIDDSPSNYEMRNSIKEYMDTVVNDDIKYFQN